MNKIDILNRDPFVEQMVSLIKNISSNKASTCIALNGAWGCGKSFVLDMLEEQLEVIQSKETASEQFLIIRYNCWQYDYYEEPLIAIVAVIRSIIQKRTKLFPDGPTKSKLLGILKAIGVSLLSIANSAAKEKTGIDFQKAYEIITTGHEKGAAKYENQHDYDIYFSFNTVISELSKVLGELSIQYTLVFIVDELDRCLPEYAIKVLERLHHLTEDRNNIITLLSIDKSQLIASINQIFGFKDPNLYLKKFINLEIELNNGIVSERFSEKYKGYIDMFSNTILPINDSLEEFFSEVFKNIDPRTQERIIHRAAVAHQVLFGEKDYSFMCVELLIVIMNSCYPHRIKFTKWFERYDNVIETGTSLPPFSGFFQEKFESIPSEVICHMGSYTLNEFVFNASNSLYGNVAYMWYSLFIKERSKKETITIKNNSVLQRLNQNIEELKKFVDMIKFIN